jgi:hypothetical protein
LARNVNGTNLLTNMEQTCSTATTDKQHIKPNKQQTITCLVVV